MDEFMPLLGCKSCFTVTYFNFLVTAQILREGDREKQKETKQCDDSKKSRVLYWYQMWIPNSYKIILCYFLVGYNDFDYDC